MSWLEVKKTAGNIIPAVATTTAIVAGLSVIESIKYIRNRPLKDYRSSFINLSLPMFAMSEPVEPKTRKIETNSKRTKVLRKTQESAKDGFLEICDWDKIIIPMDPTQSGLYTSLEDVIKFVEELDWKLVILLYDKFCIYSDFVKKEKIEERMELPILQVLQDAGKIEEMPGKGEFLVLEICVEDENGEEVETPTFAIRI